MPLIDRSCTFKKKTTSASEKHSEFCGSTAAVIPQFKGNRTRRPKSAAKGYAHGKRMGRKKIREQTLVYKNRKRKVRLGLSLDSTITL